jgi:hypothetical protein
MSIPAGAVVSQLLAWSPRLQAGGRSHSAKPKACWALWLHWPHGLHFYTAPKNPKHIRGAFRRLGKAEDGRWDGGGFSLKLYLSTSCNSVSAVQSLTRMNETEGRGPRLRKENPRKHHAVWETKTRGLRVRQLPTDPLSCGTQPAHIRMIIVAAAALGLLFHSSRSRIICFRL